MKTPISYYGGKQKLLSSILPLIPDHFTYVEPFFGGGAVFWAKDKSPVEVINDTNRELINFYQILQRDYVSLEKEIRISLHSRSMHRDAQVVYSAPHLFSDVKRAWAIWVLAAQSFGSILNGSWGYGVTKNNISKKVMNKRESFTEDLAIRLQDVQIECTDALRIIESRDTPTSVFYCDPPYPGTDCGHYDGYSIEDFEMLLDRLSKIEGKFILSSYPNSSLNEFLKANDWSQKQIVCSISVNKTRNVKTPTRKKIETITANFKI